VSKLYNFFFLWRILYLWLDHFLLPINININIINIKINTDMFLEIRKDVPKFALIWV